jgi:hypothetical protein
MLGELAIHHADLSTVTQKHLVEASKAACMSVLVNDYGIYGSIPCSMIPAAISMSLDCVTVTALE